MEHGRAGAAQGVLDGQQPHWDRTFEQNPAMFGTEPSRPARMAADLFGREGKTALLELGGGQGRDTLFFAEQGFQVTVLDYSTAGICAISETAATSDLSSRITPRCHDLRDPLPFPDESFDACYSHMLFCMALTLADLELLVREVRRVLRPGGLCVYTVRHTGDAHYGQGVFRGDGMFEVGGFIVHFFSRALVDRLAEGYEMVSVEMFEEGELPRRLFQVTMRKGA